MRLNKYLSDSGICSRRMADEWIAAGRVRVNGAVAELGTVVGDSDTVTVNGKAVGASRTPVYLAYHKPVGITCTTEGSVRGNIIDAIGYPERIFPIGRLDKESEGLILLTNHGDIVNPLLRVENAHEKEYLVTVDQPITQDFLLRMARGVPILETVTRPCRIKAEGTKRFRIILTQGLNRQIRRMCEALGYEVTRLQRLRFQAISLHDLPAGQWRYLSLEEAQTLLQSAGLSPDLASAPPKAAPTARPQGRQYVERGDLRPNPRTQAEARPNWRKR